MRQIIARLLLLLAFANLAFAPASAALPVAMNHDSAHCEQAVGDHGDVTKQAPKEKADSCCMSALPSAMMPEPMAVLTEIHAPSIDAPEIAGFIQHIIGSDPPPPRQA